MLRATSAVTEALANLLRARDYAEELEVDPWNFAVEWRLLKARGLAETDVRYLVARGLVEARREISLPAAFERTFIPHDVPRLSRDTAFILTPEGVAYCRSLADFTETSHPSAPLQDPNLTRTLLAAGPSPPPAPPDKPNWDRNRRELTFNGQVVKRYRNPSANQERILSVFQEEGWPEFIDDPLPPDKNVDSITRLQGAVKRLNRNQVKELIRFHGNGGKKVGWEAVT